MFKLAVLSVFTFTIFVGINSAQSVTSDPQSPVSHYTCELELSLASNSLGAKSAKSDSKKLKLSGRGVANCRNEKGFQFNLPAVLAIALNSSQDFPAQSLRATLEPISVDSDVNKIFDRYTPHILLGNTPSVSPNVSTARTVVVKGQKNDVLMQINLNVPPLFTSKLNITKVDLRFDNDAPDVE